MGLRERETGARAAGTSDVVGDVLGKLVVRVGEGFRLGGVFSEGIDFAGAAQHGELGAEAFADERDHFGGNPRERLFEGDADFRGRGRVVELGEIGRDVEARLGGGIVLRERRVVGRGVFRGRRLGSGGGARFGGRAAFPRKAFEGFERGGKTLRVAAAGVLQRGVRDTEFFAQRAALIFFLRRRAFPRRVLRCP